MLALLVLGGGRKKSGQQMGARLLLLTSFSLFSVAPLPVSLFARARYSGACSLTAGTGRSFEKRKKNTRKNSDASHALARNFGSGRETRRTLSGAQPLRPDVCSVRPPSVPPGWPVNRARNRRSNAVTIFFSFSFFFSKFYSPFRFLSSFTFARSKILKKKLRA